MCYVSHALQLDGVTRTTKLHSPRLSAKVQRPMTTATQQTIVLTGDYTKQGLARCVPGAYFEKEDRTWKVDDPSPRTAAIILKVFPDLAFEYPHLPDLRDELLSDVRPFDNATPLGRRISAPTVEAELAKDGKSYYDFQSLDLGYLETILERDGAAYLGWDRGLGKTIGTLSLIDATNSRTCIVVAPNTAKESVWGEAVRKFLPTHECIVLRNVKKHREWDLQRFKTMDQSREPVVLVVHYEALSIIAGPRGDGFKRLAKTIDLVAFDEAHRLKNPSTKMVKAAKKVKAKRTLMLSGSIIQNHAEELYAPLSIMFPDVYKSKWRDWCDRFLDYVDGPFARECIGIKPHKIGEMRRELGVFMTYRRKEDEIDLPELTEQTLLVELSAEQRRVYTELQENFVAKVGAEDYIVASDGLSMLTRLRQIATGLDFFAEEVTDSSKIDLAMDLIKDSEEPTVVFSWYRQPGHALAKRLEAEGIECFVVDGDVTQQDRSDMIERFQAGERQVFIGTISTLGESVNLQRASNAIFLDQSFNPAMNLQARDRVYRMGQTNKVLVTNIVAKDSVDELRVQPSLANKEALRRVILGGM